MDIGKNLSDSMNYAQKLTRDLGRLAILIIISIIPIVNFIMLGYVAKVVKESPENSEPPQLKDYGGMFIDGLKIVIVELIYIVIPLILIGFGSASLALLNWMPSYIGLAGLGVILFFIGVVLLFAVSVISYMAIVNMIKQGNMSKAFAISEILDVIKRVGWGSYILWVIIIFILGLILSGIAMIPLIGWLIALILSPIFSTFIFRSVATIYADGKGYTPSQFGTIPPPPPPPPTQTPPSQVFCPNCSAPNQSTSKFCYKCGKELKY